MAFTYRPWRDVLAGNFRSVQWLSGYWGERWLGTIGLVADATFTASMLAARVGNLTSPTQPDDALPPIGRDRQMPAYPSETPAQHRGRLRAAWDAWSKAGSPAGIVAQLVGAGYPGVTIYRPAEWGREPEEGLPYWSFFWVFFPESSGHGLDQPYLCGSAPFTCGSPSITCGSTATVAESLTLIGTVKRWKPLLWIFECVFESSGSTCGTGHVCGEASLECGGEVVAIRGQ